MDNFRNFQILDVLIESFMIENKGQMNVSHSPMGCKVTHKPTGVSVECSEYKRNHLNRDKALKKLDYLLKKFDFAGNPIDVGDHVFIIQNNRFERDVITGFTEYYIELQFSKKIISNKVLKIKNNEEK